MSSNYVPARLHMAGLVGVSNQAAAKMEAVWSNSLVVEDGMLEAPCCFWMCMSWWSPFVLIFTSWVEGKRSVSGREV